MSDPFHLRLKLGKGKLAQVDFDDYGWLSEYKWYLAEDKNGPYAETLIGGKKVRLHRLLICPDHSFKAKALNGNRLDCRRINLQLTDLEGNKIT